MTYKENIKAILECSFAGFKEEIIDSACNRILEQEPCEDTISRQSAIFLASDLKQDLPDDAHLADMVMAHNEGVLEYQTQLSLLPPVTPQPKMGCEGCVYEKTGNNSTYPCSHCGRCYTDKYKAERNDKK